MTAKEVYLQSEGDKFYERNFKNKDITKLGPSLGTQFLSDFLKENNNFKINKMLEIGCVCGQNLNFLSKEFNIKCFGIDPSREAIKAGSEIFPDIELKVGTADFLDFPDNYFNIVMFGFCFYQIDRDSIYEVLHQTNKVLKRGGFLVIYDFDTKLPYKRENKHNKDVPTYKIDISRLLIDNPEYYLVEKRSFSHTGERFVSDIQERCAMWIFYKEDERDAYI